MIPPDAPLLRADEIDCPHRLPSVSAIVKNESASISANPDSFEALIAKLFDILDSLNNHERDLQERVSAVHPEVPQERD